MATLAVVISITTFLTAILSGIFGMAGGIVLMGVLTVLLPVQIAMIYHGAIQTVSNGWRAWLLRDHISWSVVGRYCIGGVPAIVLLAILIWRPDASFVLVSLALVALIPWLRKEALPLDVQKRGQAECLGFIAQSVNTIAGVVGPLLDVFFIKSDMTRHQIVATKATTQVIAHVTKILFWSAPLISLGRDEFATTDALLIAACIPISMVGTWIGGRILDKLSDVSFREWTKYLLTAIAIIYFARGFGLV